MNRQSLSGDVAALDSAAPRSLSVAVPPDNFPNLLNEGFEFDLRGLEAFVPWVRVHPQRFTVRALPKLKVPAGAIEGKPAPKEVR